MQSTEDFDRAYCKRRLEMLAQSRELQELAHLLIQLRLCIYTRHLLTLAKATYERAYAIGDLFVFVTYPDDVNAIIAEPKYWEQLNEYCNAVYAVTGITSVWVKGRDYFLRCYLNGAKWERSYA